MGRKQELSGTELDLVAAKRYYNWRPGLARWIKRQMNKRDRAAARRLARA